MESPINKKIQRSLERSAAKKKKDSNYIPVLTLRQQVLSLVTEANASALQERQITPRSALTVMDRSIERLSALKGDAKDFAVLREVSSYISTAQKTFVASASTHTDLLPQGHPLSSLNASLTPEEYRFKYSQWLAADPDVSHNARPLVAAAFSAEPGSLEREHAFMRLSVTSEKVPGYFKLDPAPIVAAFSDGNSSAARRARVALQWRDKKGRWVEMGRGANFRFRLPDGSVASASGVYVGVRPSRPGEAKSPAGLIQISGDKNLSDGIYAVQPDNTETYSARIPTEALKKAGVKPGVRPDQAAVGIPTQDEITASRQDGPTGWTKQDENTFTSDDNYTAKVTDGEYTLFRQNADGSLGDKVGEGASWADINDLANNDEESYDVVKGQDSSAGRQEVKARIQGRTKYNEEFDRLEKLVASGVDQNGNKVPAGWEATIKRGAMPEIERRAIGRDRVFGEEGLPYLEYSKTYADDNGNPVTAKAMFMRDGKFYANDKEYDSWDAAEADIPNWIKAEEDKRDRKLTPIKSEETEVPALDRGDSGDSKKSYTVDFALDSDSYDEIGLDPEKDYTDEEVANAWIKSKGLDGKVEFVKADNPSGQWPEFTFKIDENSKDAFAEAYGYDSWSDLNEDQQFDEQSTPETAPGTVVGKEYTVDFALDPDSYDEIGLDPEKEYTEQEVADAWIKSKKLEGQVEFVKANNPSGMWPEFTFKIPEESKDAFAEAYGYDSWSDLDDDQQFGDGDGPDKPPTPPSSDGSNTPGSDFSDYVIDLASGNRSPANDLQEQLDENAERLAVDFIENIYEDASDEFDLSETIKDDKPEGMSDKEFIDGAAAQMRENLEAIVGRAIEDRNDFVESGDAEPVDFDKEVFINTAIERYKELVQEELDGMREDEGDDEPPTPPTGGTPPKTPSPSTPSAPGLFSEFEAPNGAFKLRTADYDPEGRVDERSTDFTDDPERLATKFTVQDLISAFSEAIIGNSSDASVAEILNVNVDDDNELDAPSEVDLDAEIPQVSLGTPSGAGRLEFNAGEEFVPAEALFNALWHAGVDPNRVLANVYDSVTGDNKNLSKLINAQGGTPSPEEAQLVDDITAEIRQIKDATPDDEPSIANQKNEPSEELTGSLLENLPIDFENPDYYIPDSSSYVPSQEEPDENGYTDNPELLAADYETSDLIMQMLEGITDGSGAALLNFGDITTEVPVEAIRDALQLQGINTNDILVDLKRESNDMSEPDSDTPTLQAHSQMIKDLVEQTGNTLDDDTADKIRDAIDEQGLVDWSEANDEEIIEAIIDVAGPGIFSQENRDPRRFAPRAEEQPNFSPFSDAFEGEEDSVSPEQAEKLDSSAEALVNFFSGGLNGARIIAYNPQDGSIAASTRGTDLEDSQIILATAEGNVQSSAIVDEEWFGQDGAQLGWKPMSQEVVNSIYQENGRLFPSTAMSAPVVPDVVETEPQSNEAEIDSPENVTPQFNYPGPREAGYTANNVVRDSNGVAVGAGARVKALGDGRTGTILVVQNIDTRTGRDADYVRVRFDDGKVAVRSARQIFGIEGGSPIAEGEGPGQLPPARRNPVVQDPAQRFNEPPAAGTPVVAGDGSIPGVQLVDTPDDIKEFVNPDAKQSDFAMWGLRAPEIARAGRERADINKIVDLIDKEKEAGLVANDTSASREDRDKAISDQAAYKTQIETLIRDSFGVRPGVKFGRNNYTIGDRARVSYNRYASGEVEISIGFRILNENGDDIGEGSRTLNSKTVQNPDGTSTVKWEATNNILKIPNTRDKKSGFAESYNRYMEDWYIANGFERVKVYAAGDGAHWQGGLVWALNGFNWQDNQASQVPTILRRMASKPGITDEEKQIIKRMQDRVAKDNPSGNYTADTVPTPLEIALIGWYPGATNWVGKKYMVATSWYGQKRLNPEAIEQRQAINYNQSREARKRIEGKLNQAGISRELVLKMNSNEFADANPELAPYLDQIRDVLRNNRSLAVLSPAAKTALNRYTAGQLLKGEGRDATLQDIFKLRMALDAEFKADNPLAASSDFGVGSQLLDVSIEDVSRDNLPGFTVKRLGIYESGINDTYMVTHNDSGQVFYVKKDSYAAQYRIDGAGAEVQADAMLRASGVAGYEARVSNVDPEIIVMQRAGAGIPLLGDPMTATKAIGNQLTVNLPDGTTIRVDAKNFMDLLHTPEDAVRVILVDLIISNMDRHNGNLLLAVDGTDTGKIRILPIDHALSSFSPDTEGMQFTVEELFDNRGDNLYGMAMPVLTERLKQEEIIDLFRNEARIMMTQLDNPANLPTGKELDLIVKNFGSLDAYRAKIQERIDSLLSPGSEGYQAFLSALDPNYWSR